MAEVVFEQVGKVYDNGFQAVQGLDLTIHDGEFMVLVGPSGCAKSTILRMIAGLESITGGDIHIGAARVNDLPPKDRGIAMVFQNYALYPHMNAYDNMAFGLKQQKLPAAEIDQRIQQAATLLKIGHLLKHKPGQMSGGECQRVALGRAMVRQPAVFLFDEPLSNLDAKLRVSTRVGIAQLHQSLKTSQQPATMIYVTHDQVEAMTMADKIVVMRAGKIEQIGSPDDVYDRPESKYVADFIGSPGINFLNGIVVHGEGVPAVETAAGRVPLGRHVGVKPGQQVICGLRPTDLTVHADGPITATTRLLERLGHDAQLFCETPDGGFSAIVDKSARFDEGTEVRFSIPENKIHIFDAATVERLVRRLQHVLEALAADPRQPVSAIDVLDAVEDPSTTEQATDGALDRSLTHLWKPMLHTIAAGTRDVHQHKVSLLAQARAQGFAYEPGELCGLSRNRRLVHLAELPSAGDRPVVGPRAVPYDVLVLALGSGANDFGVPGVQAHCHFIDSQFQAEAFNHRLRWQLFRGALQDEAVTIDIVGAGATGVELAAELSHLMEMAAHFGDPTLRERLRLTLYESAPRILAAFPERVSESSHRVLEKLGFTIRTGTRVQAAQAQGLVTPTSPSPPTT